MKNYVEIIVENFRDRVLSESGYLETGKVRTEKVKVLADSGCTILALPQDLVERLGLTIKREGVIVTCADERKEERPIAGTLTVRVGDRSMETDCVVAPPYKLTFTPLLHKDVVESTVCPHQKAVSTFLPPAQRASWPGGRITSPVE